VREQQQKGVVRRHRFVGMPGGVRKMMRGDLAEARCASRQDFLRGLCEAARAAELGALHAPTAVDLVTEDLSLPARFTSPLNPPVLHANLAAFERLLAHNRKASIAWAHAGSDPLGNWTPALSRELLGKHPNLYMSVRIPPGPGPGGMRPPGPGPAGARPSLIISPNGEVNPEWLGLLKDFPDRFVIGSDQFMAPPELTGEGYGIQAAKKSALGAPAVRERTRKLLASLPADVARKIAYENAQHLYKLGP
ncbi:MAG: hypothetical protein ABSE73_17760, partial [Planctomycetota bacterium]